MKRTIVGLSTIAVLATGTIALATPAQALRHTEYCDGTTLVIHTDNGGYGTIDNSVKCS